MNLSTRTILIFLLISAQYIYTVNAIPEESWLERPHLTGAWGGLREKLDDRGINPYANYTAGFWANLRGGFETGARYVGFAQWGVDADLGRLLGWSGARFHIGWHSYHGGQPSTDLVGQFTTTFVSAWEAADSFRFYEVYLRQELLVGRLVFKVGQLAADDDFFVSNQAEALLNATFEFLSIGRDNQIGPFYPLAAPGVYVNIRPMKRWYARAGVYTADVGEDISSNIGFDWSFDGGAFFLGEVGTKQNPFDRSGTYKLGVAGTTATGRSLRSGETVDGAYGLYAMIDQVLTVDDKGRSKLGAFMGAQFAPEEDRSIIRWDLDAGLKLTGPLPGRNRDILSVGVAFIKFGSDYLSAQRSQGNDVSKHQLTVEFTYRVQVTGWLTVQPDLQVFFDPHFSLRDAIVFGLQTVIDL